LLRFLHVHLNRSRKSEDGVGVEEQVDDEDTESRLRAWCVMLRCRGCEADPFPWFDTPRTEAPCPCVTECLEMLIDWACWDKFNLLF
jgi:hypothetical protein